MVQNIDQDIIDWLIQGDPSIKWQTLQDLCDEKEEEVYFVREQIENEGWGKRLLEAQDPSGTWAKGLYNPKWKSTTYTLLILRRMGLLPGARTVEKGCRLLLDNGILEDGGINFTKSKKKNSETCITGLVFGILSYFRIEDERLNDIFRYLINNQLSDGGWNCRYPQNARHSSFHTTLMVLEALYEYQNFITKTSKYLKRIQLEAHEFLLNHHLYKSHTTGKIVDKKMLLLSFPPRWKYNILSSLDYFQKINHSYDKRFSDSIAILLEKEKKGKWPLQQKIKGSTWFEMEKGKKPSRWNTLRAYRVLKWWDSIIDNNES